MVLRTSLAKLSRFNRTFMELKFERFKKLNIIIIRFNRTFINKKVHIKSV